MGKVKTSVYIDEELWKEFKELARRERNEVSKLLEEALMNYLIGDVLGEIDDSNIPIWFDPLKVKGEKSENILREMRYEREKSISGQ
ncbi:ribbon-helix-helix protein, CopG family [Palaeococcus sp. (in: euryarchaeotes)]